MALDFEISPLIDPPKQQPAVNAPAPAPVVPPATTPGPVPVQPPPPIVSTKNKSSRLLKSLILVAAGLFVVTIGALWWGGNSFADKDVTLTLEAPDHVTSGDEVTYHITYKNNTKLALSQMSFRLFYPEKSIIMKDGKPTTPESEGFTVDSLDPGQSGTKEFKIFMVGDKGTIRTARLNLIFNAGKLKSSFQKEVTAATTISLLPVTLTLVAPPTTVTGSPVQYVLDVRNDSEQDISDLKLVFTYPDGFVVQSMKPDPSTGNTTWAIPTLSTAAGKRITINGALTGNERDTKTVTAVLQRNLNGQYVDYVRTEAFTVISSPLLSVTVSPTGGRDYVAFPGDTLRYVVTYGNTSRYTLLALNLGVKLEGEMYDTAHLSANAGFYDDSTQTINFTSAGVPDLASLPPGKTGKLTFTVPLKPGLSGTSGSGAQSIYVKATAKFSTTNVPTGADGDDISASDSVITKIGSQPTLGQQILFDGNAGSGPMPPAVGSQTTFTVLWQLTNPGNDVRNAVVTGALPPGVTFKGNQATQNGSAPLYDAVHNTVTWAVGTLPFGTGNGMPKYEATFQISITPASNQVNTSPKLISGALLRGTDGFTGQQVQSSAKDLTTSDIENHEDQGQVQ